MTLRNSQKQARQALPSIQVAVLAPSINTLSQHSTSFSTLEALDLQPPGPAAAAQETYLKQINRTMSLRQVKLVEGADSRWLAANSDGLCS
jgi:hypothetical protein